jgi:Ca-activated chloride channel homolog
LDIEFQYPEAFWLLLLIPLIVLLFIGYRLWKRRMIRRIGEKRLVERLIANHSRKKEFWKLVLILLTVGLGCIALANPRTPDKMSEESRNGIDVLIALDVSNSMLATDVPPSRLDNAKQLLRMMVDKMPNDRIGLLLIAGHGYLQMPLSTDHEAAKMFINTAAPGVVPEQGTSIGDALEKAEFAFDDSPRFKTIVLVTDGETHDENAMEVAKRLAKRGIMINTIGIGSASGATIIDTATHAAKTDEQGNVVISRLNEQLLKDLAAISNGRYINLSQPEVAINDLLDQYKNVQRKALPDENSLNYISFYWWFLLPMLLLLGFEMFVPDRKKLKE